jgi:hypothetical protein
MTNLTGHFEGDWTYRSYSNNPDPKVDPNTLLFGFDVLSIKEPSFGTLAGTIGGDGWQLQLKGGFGYGNPMSASFQGTGSSTANLGPTTISAILRRSGPTESTSVRRLSVQLCEP